jgi:hypothetical protein
MGNAGVDTYAGGMPPDITAKHTNDGTVDADYTWDRPPTTYLSALQYLRLLLVKARLNATGSVKWQPAPLELDDSEDDGI